MKYIKVFRNNIVVDTYLNDKIDDILEKYGYRYSLNKISDDDKHLVIDNYNKKKFSCICYMSSKDNPILMGSNLKDDDFVYEFFINDSISFDHVLSYLKSESRDLLNWETNHYLNIRDPFLSKIRSCKIERIIF